METTNVIKLPDDVAKAYKVAPGAVREFMIESGRVDLNKVSLKVAEKLVAKGVLIPIKEEPRSKEKVS